MGNVTVTAKKDFYDRGNSIPRTRGQQFELKEDYAKTLGDSISIGKKIKEEIPKVEEPAKEEKKKGKVEDFTMEKVQKDTANAGEKVQPERIAKAQRTGKSGQIKAKGGKRGK